jgi:hypothetical protein
VLLVGFPARMLGHGAAGEVVSVMALCGAAQLLKFTFN